MSQEGETGMQENTSNPDKRGKALNQERASRGIPTHRTLKPPNSIPKPGAHTAAGKLGSKPTLASKENDSAPRAAPRVGAAGGRPPSSHPASASAAGSKPRTGGARAAAAAQSARTARKPLSASDPSGAGRQPAARPLVKAAAGPRQGRPRPRGMATVGGGAPLFATPGDTSQLHPAIIKAARRSGQLNLSSRELTEVPPKVWRINEIDNEEAKQLTMEMDGGGEERWWDQKPLAKLLLCGNRLTALSDELGLLTHLTTLDVHDNALTSLPESVGHLQSLTRLVVSHNQLRQLPGQLFGVTTLRQLLADHNRLEQLPEQTGDCLDLELLDVSHNCLTSLPSGLGYLHRLTRLAASDNRLTSLPDEIGSMTSAGHHGGGMRHLDLSRNSLTALPASMGQLYQLEVLDLRQNQLTELPELTDCHALKELHVGFNQIKEMSVELVESIKSVVTLDLSNNKLEALPDEISCLQRLERLDLRNNDLAVPPLRLCLLPLLKSVQLEGNAMRSVRRDLLTRSTQQLLRHFRERLQGQAAVEGLLIPGLSDAGGGGPCDVPDSQAAERDRLHEVHKMKSSRLLSHSGQKATEIPGDLFAMGQEAEVTTVDFSKNILTSVPADNLLLLSGHLSELNVSGNRLTELPEALGQCRRLTYLNASSNQLAGLPGSLATLQHLREVALSMNRLTAIPEVLYSVPSLEIILASDNQITEIQVEPLRKLTRLATLDLRNNSIAHVPAKLGYMEQLRSLGLEGNLFKQPRPAILAQGTASILQYLKDRVPMSERTE
ncbi:leucine-rich repeat-containing protein 40-like isoform X1 [Amphibalanus amphitrite]|uniref:leucine-rich repeat-containing protein 40-like isoform X1 n=1 Tax=Amphibalanus amphitrite TaxID=1232801 RepID=UPI001C90D8E2|nr:leucine-rich repeat-containing protein 40-like isoform X1 [Amphibalanus amphitrite]XP_043195068.1 leucine-rich repeat-containing protein 40-like isoform X1 [Amphibalanus amphitrite]